jgi:hypothetical protein
MNFIWEIYRELNPDLPRAGLKTKTDYELHYIKHGRNENRKFNIYQAFPDFNPEQYSFNYKLYLNKTNLEIHWMLKGRYEHKTYLKIPNEEPKPKEVKVVKDVKEETKEVKVEPKSKEDTKEVKVEPKPKEETKEVKVEPKPKEKTKELKVESKPKEVKVEAKSKEEPKEVKVEANPKEEVQTDKEEPKEEKQYNNEFNVLGLHQIYISNDLGHLDRICNIYNIKQNREPNKKLLLFGLYNTTDYSILNSHKSQIYIMWGGTDEQMLSVKSSQLIQKSVHIHHIAISKNIETRLRNRGFQRITYINLDLTDYTIFKQVDKKGNKIFIYNGYNKGQEIKYGKSIYDQIMYKMPQYDYILSNELGGIPNSKMVDIYKQCFIGLRLTLEDGNANMVSELKAMGIPVVHNISEYGLKWQTVEDVITLIKENSTTNGTNLDLYNNNFEQVHLDIINTNIDDFKDDIEKYKKILFICSDYPGYGGAATNCYRLQNFFKKEHDVYTIYYNFDGDPNRKIEKNNEYCIVDENNIDVILKTLKFIPDLIILKSFVNKINLKKVFTCPIYYLIPGIYLNGLDKYYYNLTTKEEHYKYINKSVLKQIVNSDKIYCNSNHTKILLKRLYNVNSTLFYSSFINFYKQSIQTDYNFSNRKYDYGLITSNFKRPIKNILTSINSLKNKKNVILIGTNSSLFKSYGFTCIESVSPEDMSIYYKQIKYVIQDSYYESCSNVKVEAIFNGCTIINSKSDILQKNILENSIHVLSKSEIYIIDNYVHSEYQTLISYIEYFKKINIKLYYLLLSNKTYKLNDYNEHIRIQDNTKSLELNNVIKKWLTKNVEQVLYSKSVYSNISDIISIFRNKNLLIENMFSSITEMKVKIFINFKFSDVPYGGGNQFIMNLVHYLSKFSNICITYELEENTDIYFIIDIRKGTFKKYSFEQIYEYKEKKGGLIIYRINDCDITREKCNLEELIVSNSSKIDYYVFNSNFIHKYYNDKYDEFQNIPYRIMYNTANCTLFYPSSPKSKKLNKKIKIVTHHWSDNINKGYQIYYDFYNYCKSRDDVELIILGRKFADGFENPPPVLGPYKGNELANLLRECDIYITASKYDSCPMHLLEGLACGLPVLYLDHVGGVKDICELSEHKVGEPFLNINECIEKLDKIRNNYEFYYNNILKNIELYNSNYCYAEYTKLFLSTK